MPRALLLFTPEVDLTESGDTFDTNAGVDYVLINRLTESIALYANGHDLSDPLLSPLFGDVSAFPPTFLQAGTRDLFLSNTVRMHRKLRAGERRGRAPRLGGDAARRVLRRCSRRRRGRRRDAGFHRQAPLSAPSTSRSSSEAWARARNASANTATPLGHPVRERDDLARRGDVVGGVDAMRAPGVVEGDLG